MKDSKQRLFELMGKLDSKFILNEDAPLNNPDQENNSNQEEDQIKKVLIEKLNILDWNSSDGQVKRKQLAQTIGTLSGQIVGFLSDSTTNEEKANNIKNKLNGGALISTIIGVGGVIFNSHFTGPASLSEIWNEGFSIIWEKGFGGFDIGGVFWLKLALFLFALKTIHSLLVKGFSVMKTLGGIWSFTKRLFTGNLLKEIDEPDGEIPNLAQTLDSISFS